MKALVYDAPESFEVKEIPPPTAGPGQVLIRVMACGICKTDLHIHRGKFIATFPLTPGHEFAGEVAEVGEGVRDFAPGDRVTADNAVPCGYCYYCRRNKPLYCENFYSLGCNGPGGFAEYVLVGHDKVFRLPDGLSYEQAAFTEPTACVVHCMDVVDVQPADEVLLFGAGPAGLVLAQMIKRCGASSLVVAAPTESKLRIAERLAADQTVKIERSEPAAAREEFLVRQKAASALPPVRVEPAGDKRRIQTRVEQKGEHTTLTMYLDSLVDENEVKRARVETLGDDSVVVTMGGKKILYRIPRGADNQAQQPRK